MDGYLYIGMGDGGDGGDPGNRAQDKDSLLGKMLRIDIDRTQGSKRYRSPSSNPYVGEPGLNEIWQRGLRNPWRFSFDRATGNLLIGDVGQQDWEEIDLARRTSTGPGRGFNWGWRVMEGIHCYRPSSGCNKDGKILPLLEYGHGGGKCAVSGGYVYRGSRDRRPPGLVRVRRLLHRRDLGCSTRPTRDRPTRSGSPGRAPGGSSADSARTRTARSTSWTRGTTPCTRSSRAEP